MSESLSTKRLYDLSLLESMDNADEEFVNTLKQVFVTTTPPASKQMVEACDAEDWDTASKIAHKIKSSVDILNITTVKDDIRTIENSARERKDLQTLPALARKADEVIRTVAAQIEQGL